MKPAPVTILEHYSHLLTNNTVILKLTWKPDDQVNGYDLKYSISWWKAGEIASEVNKYFLTKKKKIASTDP